MFYLGQHQYSPHETLLPGTSPPTRRSLLQLAKCHRGGSARPSRPTSTPAFALLLAVPLEQAEEMTGNRTEMTLADGAITRDPIYRSVSSGANR